MDLETRAVLVVARLLRALDDANPDVGMGPSDNHFIDRAATELELRLVDFDRVAILLEMQRR